MVSYLILILNLIICYVFKKQYFIIIINCNLISAGSCYLLKLVYRAHKLKEIEPEYLELKDRFIEIRTFNVDFCTEDQLVKRCNELGFSKEVKEMCIKMFIDKVPYNKLADEYFMEPSSIAIKKMRLKKKLNK